MSELRLYLRRDSLRDGNECAWVRLADDGRVAASGTDLDALPEARRCHLVLAADLVNLVPVGLPDLPPHKLQGLLPAAAEAHALAEAEQLQVAWLGRDDAGHSWLAVVDKTWLQGILKNLKERGLAVDAALPESLLLPIEAGAWSLLRQADGSVLRSGPWQAHALDGGEPPAGLRLAGPLPARLDVYQGSALHGVEAERWQAELGLPVRDMGAWSWREAAWPAGPDLLQGALRPRHGRLDWPAMARTLAWGLALLAGIQLAGAIVDWTLLAREQARLQADMRNLAERALPAHSAIVDPAWQVGEQLKALHAAEGEGEGGFLTLLSRIGTAWPTGIGTPKQVEYRDGTVTLHFDPASPATGLESLQAALAQAGLQVAGSGSTLTVREGNVPVMAGGRHGN